MSYLRKSWLAGLALIVGASVAGAQGPPPERHERFGEHGRRPGWEQGHDNDFRRGMGPGMGRRMQGPGRGGFFGRGSMMTPQMRERLGITAEQSAKMQAQRSAFAKSSIRARSEMRIKQMELAELMRAENPDRAAIDKKMRELSDARAAIGKSQMDYLFSMRDTLTPEQREQMKQILQERRGPGMGQGFERGPMPRGPRRPPPPPAPPTEPGL